MYSPCGVVISLPRFSPLFVGAVVAMEHYDQTYYLLDLFQSPICRGRRCNEEVEDYLRLMRGFQSPICRGRRCNQGNVERSRDRLPVSVPYLSGQALQLQSDWMHKWMVIMFQSPICRDRRCNGQAFA